MGPQVMSISTVEVNGAAEDALRAPPTVPKTLAVLKSDWPLERESNELASSQSLVSHEVRVNFLSQALSRLRCYAPASFFYYCFSFQIDRRFAFSVGRGRKEPYIAHYDGRKRKEWGGKRYYHSPMSCGMWPRRLRCPRWSHDDISRQDRRRWCHKASQGPRAIHTTLVWGRSGSWCEVPGRGHTYRR